MKILSKELISQLINPRPAFSHKGDYGHSLLIVGNEGKMGAAIIAAKACLRAGTGLLTVSVPSSEKNILQIAVPEAMLIFWQNEEDIFKYFTSIGIGCGIGTDNDAQDLLTQILKQYKGPILLDADALNIVSANPYLFKFIPSKTIITPHASEFDRLFGTHLNNDARIETAIKKAKELDIIIVLKGHHTLIVNNAEAFLNTTGNAGLAKGGSGDALAGIITALLSNGYEPFTAAKIGVFIHGLAADIALEKQSMESMLITDVIDCIGLAFKDILHQKNKQ
jgi:hydroxyethylthiazole kinase-like uncharacterized protein yjeF